MKHRTPEQFTHYHTAEGMNLGDGIPPCPDTIRSRSARELWAQSVTILSSRKPMNAAQTAALEKEIRSLSEPPYPSPSKIARTVRAKVLG